jgi:uncharacterized protein YndB with AHSA1/START domain
VPTVTRARSVRAAPEDVWRVISDPARLPTWWPNVQRVEDADPEAWTNVLTSPRGKPVRADYSLVEADALRRLSWRQEVEETPFERILQESVTVIELRPDADGTTVAITLRHRPRGFARFGFLQLRRAARRQADEALAGLARALGERDA